MNLIATLTGNAMVRRLIPVALFAVVSVLGAFGSLLAPVNAQPIRAATRAELLYSTHCIGCHDTEIHWRDKKLVTDRESLRSEVRRWQDIQGLGWGRAEIDDVTRYLQARYYPDLKSD
jgi:mono/diheme cytochrome c family protein